MPGVVETAPASRRLCGGFGTDLMLKDLGLVGVGDYLPTHTFLRMSYFWYVRARGATREPSRSAPQEFQSANHRVQAHTPRSCVIRPRENRTLLLSAAH